MLLIDGTRFVSARVPKARVTDVILTHSHRDHYDPEFLASLAPIRIHAHRSWAGEISVPGAEVCPFDTFAPFEAAGFSVTAMPANHSTERKYETPVHFLLKKDGKAVFYATDGAWLLNAEWHALCAESLDAAVFDATIGAGYPGDFRVFEHNSIEMLRLIVRTLRRPMFGRESAEKVFPSILKEGAPVYLTHMARTLHPSHAEIERMYEGEFIPARDGMEAVI